VSTGRRTGDDKSGADTAPKLSSCFSSGSSDVGIEIFSEKVGAGADVIREIFDEETVGGGFVLAVAECSAVVVACRRVLGSAVLIGVAIAGVKHGASLFAAPAEELAVSLEDALLPSCLPQQRQGQEGNGGIADEHARSHLDSMSSLEGHCFMEKISLRLVILQNDCTVVGKMNKEYSVETPIKAFLLDNSTKENAYGLTLSSLFHNFAKMHNELLTLLNAKKNQIAQYRCLNLYN
jgi:hypothetical protein